MTEQELLRRFGGLIDKHGGTYAAAGTRLGYCPQYLGRIARGAAPVPDPLLAEMGVRRTVVYEEAQ